MRWSAVAIMLATTLECAAGFQAATTPLRRPLSRRWLFPAPGEGLAAALAGGTVGVIGSVVAIEAKQRAVQKSKDCPYCNGTGSLICAACLGAGCPACNHMGSIVCENCKGRGRFIPTMLDSRASRDPESSAEDIGLL